MTPEINHAILPSKNMVEQFIIDMESSQPIEAIANKVPAACEENKFALLQTYAYHEIVESKGFPIKRKVFIYEICQAKLAAMMLTTNPAFAIFMPCKIALYEQGNKTIISTMNMEIMLKVIQDDAELFTQASVMFSTIVAMMNSLK